MPDEGLPRGGRRAPAPPPALHAEVTRARLLEQMAQRFSVPLTTVVAGAGFGKSTLLAQAIRANLADPRGIDAWVSCEPDDGDAEHLAQAILAALDRQSDRRDPLQRVVDALAQLAPVDVCVVFDDLHEVPDGTSGAELLAEIVRARPPHVHLVLASRRRPSVPLTRLRAAGQVVDVGGSELAFTDAEAEALVGLLGHEPSRVEGLTALSGWPSLVRLWLSAPAGSEPHFLLEGIVGALPADDRAALLALGTLGWGTPGDVAVVAGGAPVDLVHLADRVPLIQRADDGWYGVHQLWEDAVERIFSAEDRRGPQERALALFHERGETLRMGWRALRWGDVAALRIAALGLVRDTLGALPIDTAARWLAEAPVAARETPELRLLELAVRQARRYDDETLGDELDGVTDAFMSVGDHHGAGIALGVGAVVAHTRGDERRLLSIDLRARALSTDEQPMLRFLAGMMTAALASLRGDADGAAAVIAGLTSQGIPASMTEFETRLHANMLGMAGRADEAVVVAEPLLDSPSPYVRTIPAHARWLAGDPSAFLGGRLTVDPGAGTNERYHLYHATFGTAVAASLGDRATVEALRPVIEKFTAGHVDARDRAMIAVATAIRHVSDHDDEAARQTIAECEDNDVEPIGLAELHLRRLLAVAYVGDERVRRRWREAPLGPTQARQRAIADDLLAARAGELDRARLLPIAPLVLTTLPLPWSVELACRAVTAGCAHGRRLALGLADLAASAVRTELEYAAANGDDAVRAGATVLLDVVPDPSRPTVTIGVLGPLELTVGDTAVEAADLRRRRVRTLLELLVLAGPLRRDRLVDVLWPDLDSAAAGRNLRVTLSRLRSVLEPGRLVGASCPALRIDTETVGVAPPPCVDVDLWQFRRDVEAADAAARNDDPAGTVTFLERAASRWRGEPFPDVTASGDIASAVVEVRRLLTDTALRLGEMLLVSGRFADAAAWAERVKQAAPYDERAHRLAIAAHLQRRDREAVHAAVVAARTMLDGLGVEPEPGTRMLFRQAEVHIERVGSAA